MCAALRPLARTFHALNLGNLALTSPSHTLIQADAATLLIVLDLPIKLGKCRSIYWNVTAEGAASESCAVDGRAAALGMLNCRRDFFFLSIAF
jgi:hypothetical protein